MNKIHRDTSWSLTRLKDAPITLVLVTGALAFVGGYAVRGHAPAAGQATDGPSANARTGLFAAMREQPSAIMHTALDNQQGGKEPVSGKIGLLKRAVLDFDPRKQPMDDYNQLILAARDDAGLREDIRKQFEQARDPQLKNRLSILMTHIGTPDMKGYADTLSASTDPARRAEGFRILTTMETNRMSSDARKQLIGALEKETNDQALRTLITGMTPGEIRPPQEVSAIVKRLSDLSKHPDVTVRAAAIGSLARWGEGDKVEGVITEALSDGNPDVVSAAIHASSEANIKTPAIKNMLFQIASQQSASIDFRRHAAGTLGNYNLNAQDFERLMQLRQELGAKDM